MLPDQAASPPLEARWRGTHPPPLLAFAAWHVIMTAHCGHMRSSLQSHAQLLDFEVQARQHQTRPLRLRQPQRALGGGARCVGRRGRGRAGVRRRLLQHGQLVLHRANLQRKELCFERVGRRQQRGALRLCLHRHHLCLHLLKRNDGVAAVSAAQAANHLGDLRRSLGARGARLESVLLAACFRQLGLKSACIGHELVHRLLLQIELSA
mmetsp:Transcript_39494/g.117474  ORF Transcript_39494/g.117474 Transcript_39494/m.117474 type:complete len:209 (-) Transcript_39494:727-1353(-)